MTTAVAGNTTMTGSMKMRIKLSITDTAVVLWALRIAYDEGVSKGVAEDDEVIKDIQRLIDTFSRSFKAKLRVGQ